MTNQLDLGPYYSDSQIKGARYLIITPGDQPFMARIVAEVTDLETARKIIRLWNAESSAASENRTWIPVSERLPDEKGHYLTVVKGVLDGYIVRSQLYKPNAHKAFSGWIHNPVTHWQPLPEAPK